MYVYAYKWNWFHRWRWQYVFSSCSNQIFRAPLRWLKKEGNLIKLTVIFWSSSFFSSFLIWALSSSSIKRSRPTANSKIEESQDDVMTWYQNPMVTQHCSTSCFPLYICLLLNLLLYNLYCWLNIVSHGEPMNYWLTKVSHLCI